MSPWNTRGKQQPLPTRVIRKVTQLGGEMGQFQHNRPSNRELGMKFFTKRNNWDPNDFFHQFWWSIEFHLLFPFSAAARYIFTAPTCTTTIVSLEPCALGLILRFNKTSLRNGLPG